MVAWAKPSYLTPHPSPKAKMPSPLPGFEPHHENRLADATPSLHSNSFFLIPVFHFPWSEKGREERLAAKTSNTTA